jgi:hypothetical protein
MCADAMVGEAPAQSAKTVVFRAIRIATALATDPSPGSGSAARASAFLQQKNVKYFCIGAVYRRRLPHDQQAGDGRFAVSPPETWKGGVR